MKNNAICSRSPYQVKVALELVDTIKSLTASAQKQLLELLYNLSVNPHPMQSYKIRGAPGLYRILSDQAYLVYRVEEKNSEVFVFSLAKP